MEKTLADLLIICGTIIAIINGMLKGYISTGASAAVILTVCIFFVAARRHLMVRLITTGIPVYVFCRQYGITRPKEIVEFVMALLPLLIVALGLYIMFKPLFFKKNRQDQKNS
jgi:hypothetical protein